MQTLVRAIIYIFGGLVLGALVFTLVALLPFLKLDQQSAAYWGAGVGAVAGFVYGLTRRFA